MKHIIAYIKHHKLNKVTYELRKIDGLTGMTVMEVKGFGRGKKENIPIEEQLEDFVPHVKIEIFCRDDLTDVIVETIEKNAHTGLRGDGKIYICGAEQAIRISTGERGDMAI